ncbi:uncharacterized protein ARMOST_05088 [Armillaria ostoyae]|uniref:Uncharacterized protein n=1 Tax=Armillaria ostoyae TaxID=47428 RepID=A0A284QZA9_ARMOS|nr:uncharacterized protein ARMOST_05088 [Armillaria ostoyae]
MKSLPLHIAYNVCSGYSLGAVLTYQELTKKRRGMAKRDAGEYGRSSPRRLCLRSNLVTAGFFKQQAIGERFVEHGCSRIRKTICRNMLADPNSSTGPTGDFRSPKPS